MDKFALVCWSNRDDKGTFSVVPSTWVTSTKNIPNNKYLVEWRIGKKLPNGKWPAHWASIVKTSDNRQALERFIDSPATTPGYTSLDCEMNGQEFSTKCNKRQKLRRNEYNNNSFPVAHAHKKTYSISTALSPLTEELFQTNECEKCLLLKGIILAQKKKITKLESNIAQDLPNVINELREIISTANRERMTPTTQEINQEMLHIPNKTMDDNVEIFPSTDVYVSSLVWADLEQCDKPSIYIRGLLNNLFPIETLLKSNLRGGFSKRESVVEGKKEPLDQKIVEAMLQATLKKFPGRTNKTALGITINNHLTYLRGRSSKSNKCQI